MSAISRSTEKDRAAREAYQQLAAAADEFERYANPHAGRIAAIADRVAEAFHLAPQDRKSLRIAARMHDLGEVAMERDYIQRAGSLTDEERIDLQRHPVIGEQEAARASADRDVQLLVRWHHEWWNGSGYPDALRQDEIPLAARILRLADSYAALTDARPYRPALTEEEARTRIVGNTGIEFDPAVVSVLLSLEDVEELRSFAKPAEATNSTSADDGWNLFSLFMK
ncbi:MAG TPA: HD domain-containing phosphohydrolase [Pyrinomonadaceae bacterium]|jgi:HD-GYP domain-containing protein (c-di-GMP phosphodiesterase class II)|nr:HD domain-containing phosphohydrolase [Pyrinomonadaceae bacterium]